MSVQSGQIPSVLQNLRLPIISSPMFTVSYPELVVAQCKAGVVGSFPALNARQPELLGEWLQVIQEDLDSYQAQNPNSIVGPIAVNQIVHESNVRLDKDIETCVKHKVPIIITSLRAPAKEIIDEVHAYGGIILHDVVNLRHAQKALNAGVDGLIAVAAGAGGHAGTMSPLALIGELRRVFSGPIALSGSIATGQAVLAAQVMGADFAYVGTRFIASREANASDAYKDSIVNSNAIDIIYSNYFSGVHANYLRESIVNAGLDPDSLKEGHKDNMSFSDGSSKPKAWKDIWGAGQGVGQIDELLTVAEIVDKFENEYKQSIKKVSTIA